MKSVLCTLLLFVASIAFSQQQPSPATPPFNPNPGQTGNSAPPNEQSPAEQLPPDTKAPAHDQMASPDLEKELQKALNNDPSLERTSLKAIVDDDSVVVSGTVETEKQHQMALEIAQSYAGQRKVVDKIVVKNKA
jgi:osmotically-inducible protein OsmY